MQLSNSVDGIDQRLVCELREGHSKNCKGFCEQSCRTTLPKKVQSDVPCEANNHKPRVADHLTLTQLSVAFTLMSQCPEPKPCMCTCDCDPIQYGTPLPPPPMPPFATLEPPQLSVGLLQQPYYQQQPPLSMALPQQPYYMGSLGMPMPAAGPQGMQMRNGMPIPRPGMPPRGQSLVQLSAEAGQPAQSLMQNSAEADEAFPPAGGFVMGPPPPPPPPAPPAPHRGSCPKAAGCNCYCPCRE